MLRDFWACWCETGIYTLSSQISYHKSSFPRIANIYLVHHWQGGRFRSVVQTKHTRKKKKNYNAPSLWDYFMHFVEHQLYPLFLVVNIWLQSWGTAAVHLRRFSAKLLVFWDSLTNCQITQKPEPPKCAALWRPWVMILVFLVENILVKLSRNQLLMWIVHSDNNGWSIVGRYFLGRQGKPGSIQVNQRRENGNDMLLFMFVGPGAGAAADSRDR